MNENLEFNLNVPIKITNRGEEKEAFSLTITAPTNNVLKYVSILDSELTSAIFEISKNKSQENNQGDDGSKELKGEDFVMVLSSTKADLNKCFQALENILCMTCFIDAVRFTPHMFSKMSYVDTKKLLGDYLKFFLATSLQS